MKTKVMVSDIFSNHGWSFHGIYFGFFFTLLLLPVDQLEAVTPEEFIQNIQTKFRTTSNIYIEATSNRFPGPDQKAETADTSQLILAYQYPDQFLQTLKGNNDRRQHLIINGDSMVLRYPHLEFLERKRINQRTIRKLVTENLPLAGVLIGIREGNIPSDMIDTRMENGLLNVEVQTETDEYPYKKFTGLFDPENLVPRKIKLEGRKTFTITVNKYVEEERFPAFVEKAFVSMNTKSLEAAYK